jgi:orotate phosphoribosyltransferase
MVVGPMTGSIPLVMTLVNSGFGDPNFQWSIIRDEVKDHGLRRQFVGGEPGPGDKVILIDDVASSGQSLVEAYQTVIKTGAQVLAIAPLVDRGEDALNTLQDAGIYVPYLPVLTYKDLGIEAL